MSATRCAAYVLVCMLAAATANGERTDANGHGASGEATEARRLAAERQQETTIIDKFRRMVNVNWGGHKHKTMEEPKRLVRDRTSGAGVTDKAQKGAGAHQERHSELAESPLVKQQRGWRRGVSPEEE